MPNAKTVLARQDELRAAADVNDFPRPRGHEDHSTETAHVLHLRNGGRIEPIAEYFRDPIGGGFIYEFQHGGRGVVSLRHAFEEFSVENLPADGLADEPCDLATPSPGFPRDGQVRADVRGSPGCLLPKLPSPDLVARAATSASAALQLR